MRCGILLHAKEGGLRITKVKSPELDSRYLLLQGSDMPGDDTISVFSSSRPIIAKELVSYPGQAMLAVFAPDYESAVRLSNEIDIETIKTNERDDSATLPYPLEYSWGDFNPEEDEEKKYRKIETEFTLSHRAQGGRRIYTVTAWLEGASLHVEAPTEWPELIRATVERVTGYPKRNIVIHHIPYTSKNDEYLIEPASLAAIAATASIRTGIPAEIREEAILAHPGILVKRATWVDEEGKPVSEKVSMTVDQGAFPLLPEEYQRQAMAGLIPPYSLKSFKGTVTIERSDNYPSAFSLSLGYSEALASTEYHISQLAEKSETTPHLYRLNVEREKRKFTDYLPSFELETQKKAAETVANLSAFDRKWASNSFQRHSFGFLDYIRGIGMASGTGIAGFSTTFSKEAKFGAIITYTQKHNVTVNTSMLNHPGTMKRWKKLIADRLVLESPDKVTFSDQSNSTIDTGPDVLSRIVSSFSAQLDAAAKKLATMKDTESLPVSLKFNAENISFPCEFENAGSGAVVCELMVEKSDMRPMAIALWASFSFPTILDETSLTNSLKRTLMTTLAEFGIGIEEDFKLSIEINETGIGALSSPQELARGLTIGALSSALMQIGGKQAAILPTSSRNLEEIFR